MIDVLNVVILEFFCLIIIVQLSIDSDQAHYCNNSVIDASTDDSRKVYCENMQLLDIGIGQIVTALKQNGIYRDTLIIFTSDNGGVPDTLQGCNFPFRGGKNR